MSVTTSRTNDGSASLPPRTKSDYRSRLGSVCFLCGYAGHIELAHIVPRSERVISGCVETLREWSPQLSTFRKDDFENFILLCPTHHTEYDTQGITFAPNLQAMTSMRDREVQDFTFREQLVDQGLPDPGRSLIPMEELTRGFQYLPVTIHGYPQPYHRTVYLNEDFWWDSHGNRRYPRPEIRVSAYPLLLMAYHSLNNTRRIQHEWVNGIKTQITELVQMYGRKPVSKLVLEKAKAEEQNRLAAYTKEASWDPHLQMARSMPTIPEGSHQDGSLAEHDMAVVEERGGSSRSTISDRSSSISDGAPVQEITDGDVDDEGEPVVTPAVLRTRLRWRPLKSDNPDVGSMRFATLSDFITSPGIAGAEDD